MRALVVSNMRPDAAHPERGSFVRDQVRALEAIDDVEVELFDLPPGLAALTRAFAELRRRRASADVVHCHFSLSALPAFAASAEVRGVTLHGTDVVHPRTRQLTRLILPAIDLIVAVSQPLAAQIPGARARARAQVIPTGVATDRFRPMPRAEARAALGLPQEGAQLLFPADPERPEKRHAFASALAESVGVPLLSLRGVPPEQVPLYVNAANAVLVPSAREGFGLAVLEALACDVPVLATPVGIHETALDGLAGTFCAPFALDSWRAALQGALHEVDPRIEGRERAERFSVQTMAAALVDAWRDALQQANSAKRRSVG